VQPLKIAAAYGLVELMLKILHFECVTVLVPNIYVTSLYCLAQNLPLWRLMSTFGAMH